MMFTLDNLVTQQRETLSIGLATPEDVATRAADILDTRLPKDTIETWYLVAFRVPTGVVLRLLGYSRRTDENWITSAVTGIDRQRGLLTTASGSLYALGTRGEGDVPVELVVHVAAALWQQTPSLAKAFGIPPAWY